MFGSLRNHVADIVETLAASAASNLVEIAGGQNCSLVAAVLAELRKQHRSNRHVDANAERISAANDLEQPFLCEFFAENAVLGQKSGVMEPDALF